MSDDFGLANLVGSPLVGRIVREERLSEEQPRKPRHLKTKKALKNPDSESSDEPQKDENSVSSKHIDLRI